MVSSHLRLGLPSGLFPSGFPTRTLYTPVLSPIGSRNLLPRNVQMPDSIAVYVFYVTTEFIYRF